MKGQATPERHVLAWLEDDADYRALVRPWLEPRYDVREYGDAEAFLADLDRANPDVILLDLDLPGTNGFEICRKVRERGVSTPILLLTASTEEEDFIAHAAVDAAGYLNKPIGRARLLERLAELVDGERLASPPARLAPRAATSARRYCGVQ